MSETKICRNCIHWHPDELNFQYGKCRAGVPHGALMPKDEITPYVFVFPLVCQEDACPAFSAIPPLVETSNVGKCVNQIISAFDSWYYGKGNIPMPGWLFNRKVKNFSPQIQASAKRFLIEQGRLACIPLACHGRSGLFYSLKSASKG